MHSQREESYEKLQKHRQILKEDKHILMEHEREHNRLLKIGAKTDTATEAYWESLNTGLAVDGSFKRQGFLKPKFMCDNAMQAFCLQFIDDVRSMGQMWVLEVFCWEVQGHLNVLTDVYVWLVHILFTHFIWNMFEILNIFFTICISKEAEKTEGPKL